MRHIIEQRKTPVKRKVDVIVVGGGPAGFGAALAAARNGAETLIIERYGFLGGMMTAGLVRWLPVDKLKPLEAYGETEPLQGGIVRELIDRLLEIGGTIDPAVAYQAEVGFEAYFPTEPEIDKVLLPEMLKEAGADILLHSLVVDAVREGNEVKGVIVESKSGRQAILADMVIDASGDADVAAAAGAEYEKSDNPLLMTLVAFMANVDVEKAIEYSRPEGNEKFNRLVEKATSNGDLKLSDKRISPSYPLLKVKFPQILDPKKLPPNWHRRGEAGGWFESVHGDCTSVDDLTSAELKTRAAVLPILNFFRKYVPGYENAYLAYSGTQIGLRESRRVIRGYYLTADKDMKEGLKHEDAIVKCRVGINRDLSLLTPERAPVWDIPYRCLVPKSIDGLLVAGRCISIDHKAAAVRSPRDIATCICLGQAAGTAAALSVSQKVKARAIDIRVLQATLKKQGANLE